MDDNKEVQNDDEIIKTENDDKNSDSEIIESPEKIGGENLTEEKIRELIKECLGEFMDRFQNAPEQLPGEKEQEKEPSESAEEWII